LRQKRKTQNWERKKEKGSKERERVRWETKI